MTYSSRYVHKIAPRDTDTGPNVECDSSMLGAFGTPTLGAGSARLDCRAVGKVLRAARLLGKGESIYEARRESDGRIVAFPRASIWHSIILTPIGE